MTLTLFHIPGQRDMDCVIWTLFLAILEKAIG
jgi:hypothetical protein